MKTPERLPANPPWLTDAELIEATHRKRPAGQASAFQALGVPFKRRPDGTLLVGREAVTRALSGAAAPDTRASNGLNWSKSA